MEPAHEELALLWKRRARTTEDSPAQVGAGRVCRETRREASSGREPFSDIYVKVVEDALHLRVRGPATGFGAPAPRHVLSEDQRSTSTRTRSLPHGRTRRATASPTGSTSARATSSALSTACSTLSSLTRPSAGSRRATGWKSRRPTRTTARIDGDPDHRLNGCLRTSELMDQVGHDHGLILHTSAQTSDGLLIVNLWPSRTDRKRPRPTLAVWPPCGQRRSPLTSSTRSTTRSSATPSSLSATRHAARLADPRHRIHT